MSTHDFTTDWALPPGETVQEELECLGVGLDEAAETLEVSSSFLRRFLRGSEELDSDLAKRLAEMLGSTPGFWLRLESQYQRDLERVERFRQLAEHKPFLRELPKRFMIEHGWLREWSAPGPQVAEALSYFGLEHPDDWSEYAPKCAAAFRASRARNAKFGPLAAWLRQGEILMEASRGKVAPFNAAKLRKLLPYFRAWSAREDNGAFAELVAACAQSGVFLRYVPAPPNCGAYGATWHDQTGAAVVLLSLRRRSDDHFWFSLFHEFGHLLLHGPEFCFLEGVGGLDDKLEKEADLFAAKTLIPDSPEFDRLRSKRRISHEDVIGFARRIGISPGIVVGRLQHEKVVPPQNLNKLKRKLTFADP